MSKVSELPQTFDKLEPSLTSLNNGGFTVHVKTAGLYIIFAETMWIIAGIDHLLRFCSEKKKTFWETVNANQA